MQLRDKLKEYLIDSLMRDKENLEREVKIKEDVIARLGMENGKEKKTSDDWRCKYFKLEEENCELKKKVKRLENDKTFHINELQKNSNAVKEVEELNKKLKYTNTNAYIILIKFNIKRNQLAKYLYVNGAEKRTGDFGSMVAYIKSLKEIQKNN